MKLNLRKMIVAAATVFATVGVATPVLAAEKLGNTYDEIVAGARKEGKLAVWMYLPTQPTTHRAVIDAFNKRFNLNTQAEWLPLAGPTANTRAISEASGRQVSADVIGGGTFDEVTTIVQSGLVKSYPWTQVFGKAFPGLDKLENRLQGDLRSKALVYAESHYGLAWNPQSIKDQDVPDKLVDLLDPKWKGKFAFNAFFLTPMDIVALGMGENEAIEFSKKLLANQPILAKGSGATQQTVVSGQSQFGMTISNVAERAVRAGEPLKFKLLADYIPVSDIFLYVPENSPNPNTARLFAAWFSAEGYKVADALEPLPNLLDATNKFRQMADKQVAASKAKIVRIENVADAAKDRRVREANSLLLSGQK